MYIFVKFKLMHEWHDMVYKYERFRRVVPVSTLPVFSPSFEQYNLHRQLPATWRFLCLM